MKVTLNIFMTPPPRRPIFDLFKSFGEIGNFVFPIFHKLQNSISYSDVAPKHSYLVIEGIYM